MASAWCGARVVAIDEVVELGLLLQKFWAAGWWLPSSSQVHALVAAILLWMAGLDALVWIPSRSHHTASLLRPNKACGLAKGTRCRADGFGQAETA